jgi:RND family efflux transporter MFP subunit
MLDSAFSHADSNATGSARRFWGKWLGLGILTPLLAMFGATGCNETAPTERAKKPAEVVVTTPVRDEVADFQDFTGRLDGLMTVDIRAHVSGFIMTAPFKEGDFVREGALLFQIDDRPFKAALNQAEANLKVSIADRNLQEKNARRAHEMIRNSSIAREDYDTTVATSEKSRATVGAMEAARDMAQLNLDYTHVTAPLSGRISRRQVDPGNLVTADQTVLTTIVSDQKLYAYFDVDEHTYLDLVHSTNPGQGTWLTGLQYPVLMRLANEEENRFEHTGVVNFIDNRVNATTGTVRMRGVFDNSSGLLKAGLFASIRLPIGKPYQTLLIPGVALQHDQGRTYVYVVNDKNEVAYRRVELGQELQGLHAIKKGLKEGERIIISGMQRVRPGAPVQAKVQPPPEAPPSPLVAMLTQNRRGDKETRRAGDKEKGKHVSGPFHAGS